MSRTAPYRIVIAPDSFKESLSAEHAAHAIAAGIRQVLPDAELLCLPMADGGEGTVDALLSVLDGERREHTVQGPDGQPVQAHWGWLPESRTALIEVAAAIGLAHVPPARRNPLTASSYGVGQQIMAALDAGAEQIMLGLGGSATNDGGAGMLTALGARLLDRHDALLPSGPGTLPQLHRLDLEALDPRLANTRFHIASDVGNPLCGPQGATAIFGPQKGVRPEQVAELDDYLSRFADICHATLARDLRDHPGSGAAGGIGFAALAFLNGHFRPGVELVAEQVRLAEALAEADLAYTGEGRLDRQTLMGKTPAGVARLAQQAGCPLIALAGMLEDGYEAFYDIGLSAAFSLAPGPITLEQARHDAAPLLTRAARDSARLWLAARPRHTASMAKQG